jgi:hypothetical protein
MQVPTFGRSARAVVGFLRDPRFAGDNEYVPEETPEQVMARLARYAETLRRAPGGPIDPSARRGIANVGATRTLPPRSALRSPAPPAAWSSMPATAPPWSRPPAAAVAPTAPVAIPPFAHPQQPPAFPVQPARPAASRYVFTPPRFTDVRITVVGQLLAAGGCAAAVLAFIVFSTLVASALVVVVVAAGVASIATHRSLAWWWTLGVLAGALLGRFS